MYRIVSKSIYLAACIIFLLGETKSMDSGNSSLLSDEMKNIQENRSREMPRHNLTRDSSLLPDEMTNFQENRSNKMPYHNLTRDSSLLSDEMTNFQENRSSEMPHHNLTRDSSLLSDEMTNFQENRSSEMPYDNLTRDSSLLSDEMTSIQENRSSDIPHLNLTRDFDQFNNIDTPETTFVLDDDITEMILSITLKSNIFTYVINESMNDVETAVHANTFACPETVCNDTSYSHPGDTPCFDCSECYCDEECRYFGDCCVDVERSYTTMVTPWRCVERISPSSPRLHALMIQSCSPGHGSVNGEDVRRCLEANSIHPEEIIPVTDLSTKNTYRNQFCARCNQINDFTFWELEVGCLPKEVDLKKSRDELWIDILDSGLCSIIENPPDGVYPRSCFPSEISTCNTGLPNISVSNRLCESERGPRISVEGTFYRNIFCALCNDKNIYRMPKCKNLDPFPIGDPSLKVLLDFNPRSNEESTADKRLTLEKKCKEHETYDPITENCWPIQCSPGWYYSEQNCKPVFSSAEGLGYRIGLQVLTMQGLTDTEIMATESEFEKVFKQTLLEKSVNVSHFIGQFRKIPANSSLTEIVSSNDQLFSGFIIDLQLATLSRVSQGYVERNLRVLARKSLDIDIGNDTVHVNVKPLVPCKNGIQELMTTGNLESDPYFVQYAELSLELLSMGMDYRPLFDFLDCPFIKINLSSFFYRNDDDEMSTIFINNKMVHLTPESHIYCDEVMQLCVDYLTEIQNQLESSVYSGGNQTMGIVSIVCISLSLVCLLVTFVIFCAFRQLRTLPGKNTMALVFHLFCAQILFQTGINSTENVRICRALGILIHYFWLTSFAWMAVCAYHMCSTFSNISVMRSRRNHIKVLSKFMLIAHTVALICVLSCVGYHLALSDGRHIGYGGSICFLEEPMDIGIFFAAPLGIILVFNLICFLRTIRAIRAVPNMGSVSNQTNKNHADIYFRLSVLLGFTWVFGFVATGLQNDTFWYIFIVLNGLQGVFIALAYGGTRRTSQMLRSSLSKTSMVSFASRTPSSSLHQDSFSVSHSNAKQTDKQQARHR